jgi:hypothetical protein
LPNRCQSTINVSVTLCVMPGAVAVMTGLYVADGVLPVLLVGDDADVPAVEVTPHPKETRAAKSKPITGSPRRRIRGATTSNNPIGKNPTAKTIGSPGRSPPVALAAAMVVMVTAMEAVTPLVSCTDTGLTVQVELSGAALQANANGPVEPAAGVT